MSGLQLSAEQIAEMKAEFDLMDTNADGFLTAEELTNMIKKCTGGEVTDEEIKICVDVIISGTDTNGDGKVDFNEFLASQSKWTEDPALNIYWNYLNSIIVINNMSI